MSNRLALEDSPYLQQHKDNPVDWYPWGDEAFNKAKKEHKAIFLSIGYSSCHWCHVMEHEVFENETIAAYLNEHFVSIKVDREERPDIDKHYQEVHSLLNRSTGGWPTSIFSTPENRAFYAGTYIPPEPKQQMMGFMQLIEIIAPKIAQNDTKLFENADEIQSFLKPKNAPKQATKLTPAIAEIFIKNVKHNFEPTYGGFSIAPKFPHSSTLNTMMSIYQLKPNEEIASMLTHTLDNMTAGGIYDLVDGGFCRYSTDTEWLVPHFEKMTYDNGLLCEVYLKAYKLFKDEHYLKIAKEIVSFMQAFMMENSLFYSASDADTEGEEGKYFVYTRKEVFQGIKNSGYSDDEAKKMTMRLSVSPHGNFEGHNIIRFAELKEPEWFERVKPALQEIRKPRLYPFIDRKVQTSWNAMLIKSLFELAKYDGSILTQALSSLDALIEKMSINETLMHSALINKIPKVEAFLEDYAYLGVTLISAYELTCKESYLIKAQQVANAALERYYEEGRWYFSRGEFTTEADMSDNSYPGSVGVIVDLLLSLGSVLDEKYRHFAFKTLEYYSLELFKKPIYYPYMTNQALRYIHEDQILKVPFETSVSQINSATDYPYLHIQYHKDERYMLCNNHSCFANASSLKELFK
ncbi:MAG: thioredoxin domain-containing protein [Campylobacterota bacterium]|nr:thioredoxin domain-containing protein [Campylobacterota bacterium]